MRLILTLEYDGTPFRGWAAQPGLPTIEAAVREALEATFEAAEGLAVAGRTDTGFHARRSARSRSYRYRLFTRPTPSPFEVRRSWWFPRSLDEEALAAAATTLAGKHDFRAFTPTQTQHEFFDR